MSAGTGSIPHADAESRSRRCRQVGAWDVEDVSQERARAALREHLVASRIAGDVATTVGDVLRKARAVADGESEHCFGLRDTDHASYADVLEVIGQQYGWVHTAGQDANQGAFIDPDLLLAELDRARVRLRTAAQEKQRVLVATGHPTGVLVVHQAIARWLRDQGATVPRPADGLRFLLDGHRRQVRYVGDVAVLSTGADLLHTHDARPMELVLAQAGPLDLVVADHGWAGAAAQLGMDVIGIADVNDPALPLARAQGRAAIVLPMDDNVLPSLYEPLVDYLLLPVMTAEVGRHIALG